MKKRFVAALFFYQFFVSCIFHVFFSFLEFLNIIVKDTNFGVTCMILGVVIGSYLFGYRQEKKHPNTLDGQIKKLSLSVSVINFSIFAIVSVIVFAFHLLPNISVNTFFVVTVSLRGLFIFCLYYFGSQILLRLGMNKVKNTRKNNLVTQ